MNEFFYYLTYYGTTVFKLLVLFLIFKFIFGATFKNYHSSWNTLIDGFKFSTIEFYDLLEEELKSNGIDNIRTSTVSLNEGNALSSKRLYLRVEWRDFQYDICGAPFGNGFFISWWLLYKNSLGQILISKIPFIGTWLVSKLYPETYYKIDTASMFMSYAQASVLKVIDKITNEKGVRALSETERKPILKNIFKR